MIILDWVELLNNGIFCWCIISSSLHLCIPLVSCCSLIIVQVYLHGILFFFGFLLIFVVFIHSRHFLSIVYANCCFLIVVSFCYTCPELYWISSLNPGLFLYWWFIGFGVCVNWWFALLFILKNYDIATIIILTLSIFQVNTRIVASHLLNLYRIMILVVSFNNIKIWCWKTIFYRCLYWCCKFHAHNNKIDEINTQNCTSHYEGNLHTNKVTQHSCGINDNHANIYSCLNLVNEDNRAWL